MNKSFRSIDEQVEILHLRGISTTAETRTILLREGYYAVVNGYKLPFIDEAATKAAGDDRFLPGTSFDDIYAFFCFDRDLRALVFRHLMTVEAMMRSVLSYSFCEAHRGIEDYLHRSCYTSAHEYLRDEESFEGDLDWMINTLEHHARGVEGDTSITDVRVSHYRRQYDGVPLWVLFNELTFGNLKYFYALLRKNEQNAVCNRIWEACGHTGSSPISRGGILLDLDEMVAVRNICAHEERLYNYSSESETNLGTLLKKMGLYLAESDHARLISGATRLSNTCSVQNQPIARALSRAGLLGASE